MARYITHLDASTVEALAATASRSQAFALNLFYKHLAGKASIGVAICVSHKLLSECLISLILHFVL
jgi:hypothetical protein